MGETPHERGNKEEDRGCQPNAVGREKSGEGCGVGLSRLWGTWNSRVPHSTSSWQNRRFLCVGATERHAATEREPRLEWSWFCKEAGTIIPRRERATVLINQ
jgi:hypothetical protein